MKASQLNKINQNAMEYPYKKENQPDYWSQKFREAPLLFEAGFYGINFNGKEPTMDNLQDPLSQSDTS